MSQILLFYSSKDLKLLHWSKSIFSRHRAAWVNCCSPTWKDSTPVTIQQQTAVLQAPVLLWSHSWSDIFNNAWNKKEVLYKSFWYSQLASEKAAENLWSGLVRRHTSRAVKYLGHRDALCLQAKFPCEIWACAVTGFSLFLPKVIRWFFTQPPSLSFLSEKGWDAWMEKHASGTGTSTKVPLLRSLSQLLPKWHLYSQEATTSTTRSRRDYLCTYMQLFPGAEKTLTWVKGWGTAFDANVKNAFHWCKPSSCLIWFLSACWQPKQYVGICRDAVSL